MHAFSSGLGGKHLWPALQLYLSDLGKVALHTVDQQWVLYHTEHKIWTNIYIYIEFPLCPVGVHSITLTK